MDRKLKVLTFLSLVFIVFGVILIIQVQSVGKLRLIFCDVGQGDGILIMTPGGSQVIIDSGPGTKIVECLGKYMPFWDRTIEMMLLTHPQKDHMEGQVEIFARYRVEKVFTTGIKSESELYNAWEKELRAEMAKIYTPKAGDILILESIRGQTSKEVGPLQANLALEILWPDAASLSNWQSHAPKDLNDSAIVARLTYGSICAYLTGDITKEILETLVDRTCQILKIAHHGSRTGTSESILNSVSPSIAVIQLGKNSYGHPHKEVLDLLSAKGIKVLRNDKEADIVLETNGKTLSIKN